MKAGNELTNRAFQIMKHYDMSQGEFAIASGVASNRFSFLKRGRAMGVDILLGILHNFPDVSAEWMLRGEGEMLKSKRSKAGKQAAAPALQEPEPPGYAGHENLSYLSKTILELAMKVGEIQREVNEIKSRI
jgi:hypothetical protein